ncbi:conserved hypothetical protein [Candidatus Desulfarcum epimagneticum]|uniref:SHS2 domain-containing protein n=1 Tax=uncultured Desulfobacteraceae bacterium TaxID=218296 RepID=A0A484HBI1_9BACT|nr:conserved hypothetical protein [uncultured Desulfobacteraceae bacterium]
MALGFKRKLLGLDIGSETIKAAEISRGKKGLCVENFAIRKTPGNVVENGVLKDPDAAAKAVERLFEQNGFKRKEAAISVSGLGVMVKHIQAPAMSEEDIFEAVAFESDQYLPCRMDDVHLDVHVLGKDPENPDLTHALLVAARKDFIQKYIDAARKAGLEPRVVDVDAFALQNLFEDVCGAQPECVAMLDIGASKTSINIIKEGRSCFMTHILSGCGALLEAGGEMTGPGLDEWHSEIRRALDFFESAHPGQVVHRVFVSGGGADIDDFRRILSEKDSLEARRFDPFSRMSVSDEIMEGFSPGQTASQACVCLGLAARRS